MMAIGHVAGLAGWGRSVARQGAALFQQGAHSVFGGRIHLPLGMIKSHMAGLAGLRLLGFLLGKRMPRMARVARRHPESAAGFLQALDLLLGFQADFMTRPAALHSLGHGHRLPMNRRHGLHGRPGRRVLSALELFHLGFMAFPARFRRGDLNVGHVVGGRVAVAVAIGATYVEFAVTALPPIGDNAGVELLMAFHASVGGREGRVTQGRQDQESQRREDVSDEVQVSSDFHTELSLVVCVNRGSGGRGDGTRF